MSYLMPVRDMIRVYHPRPASSSGSRHQQEHHRWSSDPGSPANAIVLGRPMLLADETRHPVSPIVRQTALWEWTTVRPGRGSSPNRRDHLDSDIFLLIIITSIIHQSHSHLLFSTHHAVTSPVLFSVGCMLLSLCVQLHTGLSDLVPWFWTDTPGSSLYQRLGAGSSVCLSVYSPSHRSCIGLHSDAKEVAFDGGGLSKNEMVTWEWKVFVATRFVAYHRALFIWIERPRCCWMGVGNLLFVR